MLGYIQKKNKVKQSIEVLVKDFSDQALYQATYEEIMNFVIGKCKVWNYPEQIYTSIFMIAITQYEKAQGLLSGFDKADIDNSLHNVEAYCQLNQKDETNNAKQSRFTA